MSAAAVSHGRRGRAARTAMAADQRVHGWRHHADECARDVRAARCGQQSPAQRHDLGARQHVLHARHRASSRSRRRAPPRPSTSCRSRWAARQATTACTSCAAWRACACPNRTRVPATPRHRASSVRSREKARNRSTGDAFAPYYNGKPTVQRGLQRERLRLHGRSCPATGAKIWIFDPTFCATATKTTGGGHAGRRRPLAGPEQSVPGLDLLPALERQRLPPRLQQVDGGCGLRLAVREREPDRQERDLRQRDADELRRPGQPVRSRADCQAGRSNPADGGYWHNKWWPIASNLPRRAPTSCGS